LESSWETVEWRGLELFQRFAGPLEELLKQLLRDRALPADTSMIEGLARPKGALVRGVKVPFRYAISGP
jgi:hypothetical protein